MYHLASSPVEGVDWHYAISCQGKKAEYIKRLERAFTSIDAGGNGMITEERLIDPSPAIMRLASQPQNRCAMISLTYSHRRMAADPPPLPPAFI